MLFRSGDGQNIRDWIYVNDHCKALNAIINNGKPGESYCIGGNNEKTNLDLVETLCEIFDSLMPLSPNKSYKELIAFVPDRLGHDFRYAIDSSKIKNQLSWMPDKDFYDGLKETAKWYIDNESWWRKIQNKI